MIKILRKNKNNEEKTIKKQKTPKIHLTLRYFTPNWMKKLCKTHFPLTKKYKKLHVNSRVKKAL
jgi:hypothetical protein